MVILVDTDVADIIHYIFLVFPTYGYVSHVRIEVHWIHMKKHLSYFFTQLDLIARNSRWASLVMVTNNQLAGIKDIYFFSIAIQSWQASWGFVIFPWHYICIILLQTSVPDIKHCSHLSNCISYILLNLDLNLNLHRWWNREARKVGLEPTPPLFGIVSKPGMFPPPPQPLICMLSTLLNNDYSNFTFIR